MPQKIQNNSKHTHFLAVCILIMLGIYGSSIQAQCIDAIIPDSSFEDGTLYYGSGPALPGTWFQDDGCTIERSLDAPNGDSVACSNGGGAYQYIRVEPFTQYYLSAMVLNGASDDYPSWGLGQFSDSVQVTTDNWTLLSKQFTTNNDTLIRIGFYSASACFDQFRMTCQPVISNTPIVEVEMPFTLRANTSNNEFEMRVKKPCHLTVFDLNGKRVIDQAMHAGSFSFGEKCSAGIYIIEVQKNGQVWRKKAIKY